MEQELVTRHPWLKKSFNRDGFLTFTSSRKLDGSWSLESPWTWSWGESFSIVPLSKELSLPAEKKDSDPFLVIELVKGSLYLRQGSGSSSWLHLLTHKEQVWLNEKGSLFSLYHQLKIELPSQAPSRAFLKAAQLCQIFNLERSFKKFPLALEVGSAPGGVCYFLIESGCEVWGVDTGLMSPELTLRSNYHHIDKAISQVKSDELPPDIHWLWNDVHLSPEDALSEIKYLIKRYQASLQGIFFTLKIPNQNWLKKQLTKWLEEFNFHCQIFNGKRQLFNLMAHKNEMIFVCLKS